MKKLLLFARVIFFFALFSCSSKNGTRTIDANPDFFITNYIGTGNGINYFKCNLDGERVCLKPNPLKNIYITPKQRYDGLDSLRIKKTRIKMGSNPVYSIEELIKEK